MIMTDARFPLSVELVIEASNPSVSRQAFRYFTLKNEEMEHTASFNVVILFRIESHFGASLSLFFETQTYPWKTSGRSSSQCLCAAGKREKFAVSRTGCRSNLGLTNIAQQIENLNAVALRFNRACFLQFLPRGKSSIFDRAT